MNVVVVGLNHKSAPIEVREKLVFDAAQTLAALKQLSERYEGSEYVLLSTCNRVELYGAADRKPDRIAEELVAFLCEFHDTTAPTFEPYLYIHENEDAVRHLLLVASSLDSMVIGEAQIIGQVKEGYRHACAARSTGKIFNRLFHSAFYTAKKVHTKTSIATGRVSVAGVAVDLAVRLFSNPARAKVVVIGAGEIGELVVQHLLQENCRDITVVNRTYEKAQDAARRYGIAAGPWEELAEQMAKANIVISSPMVQDYLYTRQSFQEAVGVQRKGPLLIIDVGVPRTFDPLINDIEDVYLYSIDDLKEVAAGNLKAREEDIAKGMEIAYERAADFMDWLRAKDIGPLIGRMKKEFRQISRNELRRFFVGERQEASCREPMEEMVNRVVNKLLHCVIKNVDSVAKENGPTEAAKLVHTIVEHAKEISCEHSPRKEAQQ